MGIAFTIMAAFALSIAALRPANEPDFRIVREDSLAESFARHLNTVHQASVQYVLDNPNFRGSLALNTLQTTTRPSGAAYLPSTIDQNTWFVPMSSHVETAPSPSGTATMIYTFLNDPADLAPFDVGPRRLAEALTDLTGFTVTAGLAVDDGGVRTLDAGRRGIAQAPVRLPFQVPANSPVRMTSLEHNDPAGVTQFIAYDPPPQDRPRACWALRPDDPNAGCTGTSDPTVQ